jgi:hypothetical protein
MVETVIVDSNINRIIALSDLHSDIHAFIICLRDCAKVIRKVPNVNTIIIPDVLKLDQDTEDMLELNLNENENLYKDNLNYEWIGGTTNIVICGDILDGSGRSQEDMKREGKNRCRDNKCTALEYDQVEIKLLRFINSMNLLAIEKGGRIYKILGNHDVANLGYYKINKIGFDLYETIPYIKKYIPRSTLQENNYHNNIKRENYFNAGKPGSYLLLQGGAYIGLIINNNIFVHGQLNHDKNLQYYIDLNNKINDPANNTLEEKKSKNVIPELTRDDFDDYDDYVDYIFSINEKEPTLWDILNKEPTLWNRGYDRAFNKDKTNIIQYNKCENVKKYLVKFYKEINDYVSERGKDYPYTSDDLRVIIGHCSQFYGNQQQIINSTFITKKVEDNIEILSGPKVRTGLQNLNLLFGIGMECNKRNLDNFATFHTSIDDEDPRFIFKVDVGSSRAFDNKHLYNPENGEQNIQLQFGQRTPQVLEINNEDNKDNIRIIRSTILNTRIHQPRQEVENLLKGTKSELKIDEVYDPDHPFIPGLAGGSYKDKYLKYKNKYIKLKKKMNN